ncbi:MAG TPA: DNRLRE domain-containing protein [Tepidisphaeraceae bacterium]|nr:DNRLRE domain-containing protein [Tepidisphaeraceae bacterium]
MLRTIFRVAALSAMGVGSTAVAQTVIQPAAADSKDVFIYSFLATTNFNSFPGFDGILASGRSASGHDLRSLVSFDITGVTLGAGQIATLNLFVADGSTVGFPVVNPSATFPIQADIFANTEDWNASTVTWATQPSFSPTVVDSQTIDGVNKYITFNVTSLVQGWLANPATNFGFSIQQPEVVVNGGSVQAVYQSAVGAQRPFLYVGPVPEPTGIAALAMAGSLLILRRRA